MTELRLRRYLLHIPPGYQAGNPMPLVLNFHGYSSNAAEQESVSGMSVKADQAGFIVVYPEGTGESQAWHFVRGPEATADLDFSRDLITYLEAQFSIDPARVYATGISNGAQMANYLGCNLSEVIAAIAPVSGGYPPGLECNPGRPVPVVAFHGTADRLIPYEGSRILMPARQWAASWAARNAMAPQLGITTKDINATEVIWNFFVEHPLQ